MLEPLIGHHKEVPDQFVDPATSYQMTTYDYVVRPIGSITLTLPPVAEAKGRIYTVLLRSTITVTITDKDDSEYWSDVTLSSEGDWALLYSDGNCWFPFENSRGPA